MACLDSATRHFFKDQVSGVNVEQTIGPWMELILPILAKVDSELHQRLSFMERFDVSVKWFLSWFSQKLNLSQCQRLFDYLLATPVHSIIYVCVGYLIHRRKQLLLL